MMECEKVRNKLTKIYGKKILCRLGTGDPEYNASTQDYKSADIAVYIHKSFRLAIVWNNVNRRKTGRVVKSFSISKTWNEINLQDDQILAIYKKMGKDANAPFEKVLVLDVDTLFSISEELRYYVKLNPSDIEWPAEMKNQNEQNYDIIEDGLRERVSTCRWERDRKFRIAVLKNYDEKCAICRCKEKKLLQAAHIVAVADGGNDSSANGVCLCANHHIMFDKELIKIDFDKHKIDYINESVKSMPWYSTFMEKFDGKILIPNNNNVS